MKQGWELETKTAAALLLAAAGAILLYWSVAFGQAAAEAWLQKKGSAGSEYTVILDGYIAMYRTLGGVLLGVGLFALLSKR